MTWTSRLSAKFRAFFRIKGWVLAIVGFQALLFTWIIIALDFYTQVSIFLGIFLATAPIFLVLLYKQRQRGFKRGKWIEPFVFIALITVGITFAYTAAQKSPDAVVGGKLTHFENTGDFNSLRYYNVPADVYYYMDFTDGGLRMIDSTPMLEKYAPVAIGLDETLNITIDFYINIKPTNVTIEFATSTDHYQLSDNFAIWYNETHTDFDVVGKRVNNVNTTCWHVNTTTAITKTFDWKPVLMFRFAGGIDLDYLASGSVTYLWAEVNTTTRMENGSIIEPAKAALSINRLPLQDAVDDSFWLITIVMLAIFIISLILSLVTSRFKILVMITLILTCAAIICLMLLIMNELHADWVGQLAGILGYLANILAVVVAVCKWFISMGLALCLIIFVTALFGKMGSMGGGEG